MGHVADHDRHIGLESGLNDDLKGSGKFARRQPDVRHQFLDMGGIGNALRQCAHEFCPGPAKDHDGRIGDRSLCAAPQQTPEKKRCMYGSVVGLIGIFLQLTGTSSPL